MTDQTLSCIQTKWIEKEETNRSKMSVKKKRAREESPTGETKTSLEPKEALALAPSILLFSLMNLFYKVLCRSFFIFVAFPFCSCWIPETFDADFDTDIKSSLSWISLHSYCQSIPRRENISNSWKSGPILQ